MQYAEVLFGRNSGKKKKGIRTTVDLYESRNEKKRIKEAKGHFRICHGVP
jgi:hypothetical protein